MGLFRNYLPLLAFAALFRADDTLRETPYAVVRGDVEHLLTEAAIASAHAPVQARDEALFAVCAFVDEAILTSQWQGRTEWARATLQRTRLDTVNAGMEFYEHCRALLRTSPTAILSQPSDRDAASANSPTDGDAASTPFSDYMHLSDKGKGAEASTDSAAREKPVSTALPEQIVPVDETWREEVLCLYGACLSMGFAGRYHDATEQHLLREVALASLERAVGGRVSLDQRALSPEAYYMPESDGPHKSFWLSCSLALAAPALATFLLYKAYDHVLDACMARCLTALGGML